MIYGFSEMIDEYKVSNLDNVSKSIKQYNTFESEKLIDLSNHIIRPDLEEKSMNKYDRYILLFIQKSIDLYHGFTRYCMSNKFDFHKIIDYYGNEYNKIVYVKEPTQYG